MSDKKKSKARQTQDRPASRVAFTDGAATNPPAMAVDAQPRAGDVRRVLQEITNEAAFRLRKP